MLFLALLLFQHLFAGLERSRPTIALFFQFNEIFGQLSDFLVGRRWIAKRFQQLRNNRLCMIRAKQKFDQKQFNCENQGKMLNLHTFSTCSSSLTIPCLSSRFAFLVSAFRLLFESISRLIPQFNSMLTKCKWRRCHSRPIFPTILFRWPHRAHETDRRENWRYFFPPRWGYIYCFFLHYQIRKISWHCCHRYLYEHTNDTFTRRSSFWNASSEHEIEEESSILFLFSSLNLKRYQGLSGSE